MPGGSRSRKRWRYEFHAIDPPRLRRSHFPWMLTEAVPARATMRTNVRAVSIEPDKPTHSRLSALAIVRGLARTSDVPERCRGEIHAPHPVASELFGFV